MVRVLFVCTGNTCRSPMAEAILRDKNIEGVEVKSAGVYASHGQEASLHAKKVLEENHISFIHQSKPLSPEMLDWATYIFTMTEGHKSALVNTYPRVMDKTFTLKEFVNDDKYDRDIMDPFGGSKEIYQMTFNELQALIDELVKKLKE